MAIEFRACGLNFVKESELPLFYKELQIGTGRISFLIEGCTMVELKVVEKIGSIHKNQSIGYMELCSIPNGLLLNFGGSSFNFIKLSNKKMINL